ncbi:uncharacterized protein LOC118197343 [Stegodyphus dumicola]|uniref:uncharacterized protein LOC118197343 n=1 Tax=Stegodyphus dumicola TaxID=202533 RepID=UPI0015B01FE2|nr:uncharacterized protein LOC118197343 [Stegodyphus dumicola]
MPEEEKKSYCTSWHLDSNQYNNNGMLLEEDRPVVPGVTVKAAAVDALVDILIESFLPIGGLKEENCNFPRVMLLMHQWFTTSDNLAQSLISRYPFQFLILWFSKFISHNMHIHY